MANDQVVNEIISTTANMLEYMLPVIAIISGLTFIVTFLLYVTVGFGRRTFRG